MAIGLGRMMGFRLPENFNFPYASRSITEFWRRWHMTLGNWMKDYLYVPLGGNRNNRTLLNLMIVFLFSGLWHGASWNFVLWGAFHGIFLVMERAGFRKILQKINPVISTFYAYIIVLSGWVLFRSENFPDALKFYDTMFSLHSINLGYLESINPRIYFMFAIALLFSFVPEKTQNRLKRFYQPLETGIIFGILTGFAMLILYLFHLGELMATGFNPFIYFRF